MLAYLALEAGIRGAIREAFLWLVAATFVDALDGVFARMARVKERTPHFDGARLDDIVDYLTFVFVPVFLLRTSGAVPGGLGGVAVVSAVLLASAYGFSRSDAKTSDHFFTGFPSYWNIVAVYMVALGLDPRLNAAILIGFVMLVFVPIGYIYPSRTPRYQALTIGLGAVWAMTILAIIFLLPSVPLPLAWISLLYPIYYFGLSFLLHMEKRRSPAGIEVHSSRRGTGTGTT